jgi:hypothetical protein
MGQPFSGMTQTGFNTTTMYGTAAQTGITGMYGYGQTGTGGGYNTLSTSPTIAPPDPSDFPVSPGSPNYITPGFSQPSPTSEESAWWWVKPASEGYSEGAYRIFNLIFWAAPITPDDVANGIASVENHINDNVTSALDEIFEEFDAGESANISSSNFELQSIKSIKDYLKALGEPGSVRFFALGGIAIGGVGLVIASGSVALPIAIFFGFWGTDQIQANAREFWEGKHQQTYGNRILGGGVLGFAYDAVPQLFFGRFIPKTGPVNAGGIVAPRPVPSLPKYDGGKTSGVLRFGESDVPLLSGYKGPSASMPKGTPGMNGNIKSHVEAHASAIMREQGLSEATLYINRIPCPGKTGCDAMLPRMLPEGARLRVIGPNGFERIYVGLPD